MTAATDGPAAGSSDDPSRLGEEPAGSEEAPLFQSTGTPMLLRGATVVRPRSGTVEPADVLLAGGKVEAIGDSLTVPRGARVFDAHGRWVVPGWIDLQVNDFDWTARGVKDPLGHAARVRAILRHQARRGVAGLALATMAAPIDELLAYLQGVKLVLDRQRAAEDGALLGALVEGTFLNPECVGAHNPAWVQRPEKGLLDRILDTGAVRLINLPPETAPEAVDLIRHATSRGAIVGVGHAKPHAERLREAVGAGARYVIHLGNGPTGSSLKAFHGGGMLEEALRDDRLTVTLILDGIHVHPQIVRDWIARKEVSRVIGISDAAFATGPPPGRFEVLGVRGELSADGKYLRVVGGPVEGEPRSREPSHCGLSSDFGSLFASAIGMRDVFENALNWLSAEMAGVHHRKHPALPIEDAMLAAARISSTNAADLLGEPARGSIEVGGRGDLLLLDVSGSPGAQRVRILASWMG